MSREEARERLRRRTREALSRAQREFEGRYTEELSALRGLSDSEIDALTPDSTDIEVWDRLVGVVEEASRLNLDHAALAQRIRDLGGVAVRIARKVPSLASLL